MFVRKEIKEKMAVIAVLAVLLLSGCLAIYSDSSFAEGEEGPSVEEYGPVELTIDGKTEEHDAFVYQGVVYAVTSDRESEEEAGVYGLVSDFDIYIVVCSFSFGEDDDEINYSVTNVLPEFSNVKTAEPIILADTITDYGKDCFKGLADSGYRYTLYVGDDVSEETISGVGYDSVRKIGESAATESMTITFAKGKVTYPESKYRNQDSDEGSDMYMAPQEFVAGITTQISECSYENPYYDFDGWKDSDDGDPVAGDTASVTVYGGKVYIDADKVYDNTDPHSYIATWVESDYDEDRSHFGDYPLSWMYITSAIIIILFIVGFAMLGYRTYMARKA